MTPDDSEVAEAKAKLRSLGWFVRYTEWPTGHQVVLHRRSDTATHLVTGWRASEVEAWKEALLLALEWCREHHAGQHTRQDTQQDTQQDTHDGPG